MKWNIVHGLHTDDQASNLYFVCSRWTSIGALPDTLEESIHARSIAVRLNTSLSGIKNDNSFK